MAARTIRSAVSMSRGMAAILLELSSCPSCTLFNSGLRSLSYLVQVPGGGAMSQDKLSEFVKAQATELGVPGVAVGVLLDGQEIYASHGVTSLGNPLPVDEK